MSQKTVIMAFFMNNSAGNVLMKNLGVSSPETVFSPLACISKSVFKPFENIFLLKYAFFLLKHTKIYM